MISIIAAVSDDLGIGNNNDLLWHIHEDMKRFKRLTLGNNVVMGKRTWESLPVRPLPGRTNVVITDIPGERFNGALAAYSLKDAVEKCTGGKEIFIIGGGSIYRQFLPLAGRLYITHVHRTAPADIYFPEIDMDLWKPVHTEEFKEESVPYTYIIYERK